jgi:hypothetical protein
MYLMIRSDPARRFRLFRILVPLPIKWYYTQASVLRFTALLSTPWLSIKNECYKGSI